MTSDRVSDSDLISQLEVEIARHKSFLELPDIFTFVGMEEKIEPFITKTYDQSNQYDGNDYPDFSGSSFPYQNHDVNYLSAHFRDNTNGEVMNYLGIRKVTLAKHREFLIINLPPKIITLNYGMVELNTSECYKDISIRITNYVAIFPNTSPIQFYTHSGTNDPLIYIKKFKKNIRKKAKARLLQAENNLLKEHQNIKSSKLRILQNREREINFKTIVKTLPGTKI